MKRFLIATLVLAGACEGNIGDVDPFGGNPPPILPPLGSDDLSNGRLRARVWRLTPEQYETEARRLLGDLPDAGRYPAGQAQTGFSNFAAGATIDRSIAQRIIQITEDYAAWAQENAAEVSGCAGFESACMDSFIADFLSRAYRRPSTPEEQAGLRTLYDGIAAEHDAAYAFRSIVQATLMSPNVLYRSEIGAPYDGEVFGEPGEGESITVLSDYEIASLLSYSLTDEAPDDTLLQLALEGRLRDPDVRRMEAQRLMAGSHEVWRRFFWEWLDMERFDELANALEIAPSLREAMREEFNEFLGRVVVDERGTLEEVFTSNRSWANPELAEFYGVSHSGEGVAPISFDPEERGGILTQSAWLVSHGSREDEYVVRRGMGIFLRTLCRDLTPPEGLDVLAAQEELISHDAPVREQIEARSSSPVCGACHRTPDPIGLAFERFDALGRVRSEYEDGDTIDSSATIPNIGIVDGGAGVGAGLAQSEEFQNCFVRRWAHSSLGADLGEGSAWITDVTEAFMAEGGSIESMVMHMVAHPGFVERVRGAAE